MDRWEDSVVVWDEDVLELFLDNIQQKVYTLWRAGNQVEAEITLRYVQEEED